MLPQRNFSECIMKRVRVIFLLRVLAKPAIFELVALGGVAIWVVAFVHFEDVIANFKTTLSAGSVFQYIYSAIINTDLVMQVFMGVGVFASVYFVYRVVRVFRPSRHQISGQFIRA